MTTRNWLSCQITGVADYVCSSSTSFELGELRQLSLAFSAASSRIEHLINRRVEEAETEIARETNAVLA
jgi:hypothetical protein